MNAPFAGTLRNRVRFDVPIYNRDRSGERVLTWFPVAPDEGEEKEAFEERARQSGSFWVWAAVKSQPARTEGIAAGQLLATATHELQMRFRCDICADMSCVLPDGTRLDILSKPVDPDGTRERIRIHCEYRGGAA